MQIQQQTSFKCSYMFLLLSFLPYSFLTHFRAIVIHIPLPFSVLYIKKYYGKGKAFPLQAWTDPWGPGG